MSENITVMTDIESLKQKRKEIRNIWYDMRQKLYRFEITDGDKKTYARLMDEYNKSLKKLVATFNGQGFNWDCSFTEIIDQGKIKSGEYGEPVLAEGSRNQTFYTKEPDMMVETVSSHLDMKGPGKILHRRRTPFGDGYEELLVEYSYTRTVKHADKVFEVAKEWVNSSGYQDARKEVIKKYTELKGFERELEEQKARLDEWTASPEYITLSVKYHEVDMELKEIDLRLRELC